MEKKILTKDQLSEEILQRIEALGLTDQLEDIIELVNEQYKGNFEAWLSQMERARDL
jgi:hypothetical protein|nr:MAG TPA: hypothetical protein [Caudoviricetes sp.]